MPTLNGTKSADILLAPDSLDWTIFGLGGADSITGNIGNDTIDGGAGNDTLGGGDGNDTFFIGTGYGTDSYDGGIGYDILKALTDNVNIGISSITNIEEISADGHLGVTISGDASDNIFDFSNVILNGIGLIFGGNGNDTIIGNALSANIIDGGAGNDTLIGGAGDDIFQVGLNAGLDSFNGGTGFDTIIASANGAKISAAALMGIEAISGGSFFSVQIFATANDDILDFKNMTLTNIANIDGGAGNDTITGSVGDDIISGGDGDDILNGGAGNDTLSSGKGFDILSGGAGDDSFYVSSGMDIYKGGSGYDVIYAAQNGANLQIDTGLMSSIEEISANGFLGMTISAANSAGSKIDLRHIFITDDDIAGIYGGNGDDTIFGSFTYDYIYGGLGNDSLDGYNGDDELHGGGGADTLTGGLGFDTLYGDAGDDILNGGSQDDVLFGGAGNDTLMATMAGGYDEYNGDNGYDMILAESGLKNINIARFYGIEEISWDGSHLATIQGSLGDDVFDFSLVKLTGIAGIDMQSGNDAVIGSAQDDVIDGNIGNDTIIGGAGNDIITGGADVDILTGGAGNDVFKDKAANLNGDTITDFTIGDAIQIINAKDFTKVVLNYIDDGTGLAGTLHVSGVGGLSGAGVDIHLQGSFTTSSFHVASDGGTGALILL